MRRLALAMTAAIMLAAVGWFLLHRGNADGTSTEPSPSANSLDNALPAPPSAERMNSVLMAAIVDGRGEGTIVGRVRHGGAPVSGATVTATRAQGDETLSELECHCDNHCGLRLLECGCPEASEQLRTLVTERRGEVVPVARTLSASDGTFSLHGLEPGSVALWADDKMLGTAFVQPVTVGSAEVELDLDNTYVIEGTIALDHGGAVAGAWVTAIHPDHSRFFDVLADSAGRFKFGPVPPGKYAIVAGAAGLLTGHEHSSNPGKPLTITLAKPQVLDGLVLLDEKPVSGVPVHLDGNHRKRDAISASDGSFHFSALYPGEYELSAHKGTLGAELTAAASENAAAPAKLNLREGAQVSGTVRAPDGSPVTTAKVILRAKRHDDSAWVDERGHYALQGEPGNNAKLTAAAKGYVDSSEDIDLAVGQMTRDITLAPEAVLSGVVLGPAGETIVGATVSASSPDGGDKRRPWRNAAASTAETYDGGVFTLHGLLPGTYDVRATHAQFKATSLRVDAPATGVQLTLSNGATLTGDVIDARGEPANARVWVLSKGSFESDDYHQTESDDAGRFTIRGLELGEATVTAHRADESERATAVVNISSGQNQVRLRLETLLTIEGVVIGLTPGADGESVDVMANGSKESRAYAKTDTDGGFILKGLTEGDYNVEVFSAGEMVHQTVKAGTKGVRLVLNATRVTGHVVDSNGQPVSTFAVNGKRFSDAGGAFSLPVRSTRGFQLVVRADSFLPVTRQVTPQENSVTDVGNIVIGAGRDVRVQVISTEGTPLERADVWLASDWENSGMPSGFTGADGTVVLHGVNGPARLTANHATHAPNSAELGEKETEKKIVLSSGGKLLVHVVDANRKPVHATINLVERGTATHSFPAQTNASGDYLGEGMTAGRWVVMAVSADERQLHGFGEAIVEEGRQQRLEVRLAEAMKVEVDASLPPGEWQSGGAALFPPGVSVAPGSSLQRLYGLTVSGGSMETPGHFTLSEVSPGSYTLGVFLESPARSVMYLVPVQIAADQNRVRVAAPDPAALIPFKDDQEAE